MELKFDEKGLIPAIVQDYKTGKVLMMAYMNEESLRITMEEGQCCFWSRSRGKLWRKGETSGNVQKVVSIKADCDGDALLISVDKAGPACHTGSESCFFNTVFDGADTFTYEGLYELIRGRKESPREGSYTSYLFEKGLEKILKKVGEENGEVIIAAMKRDKRETVYEIADLIYHLMVLMAEAGITPDEITAELASRHVVDKKVKQETMK